MIKVVNVIVRNNEGKYQNDTNGKGDKREKTSEKKHGQISLSGIYILIPILTLKKSNISSFSLFATLARKNKLATLRYTLEVPRICNTPGQPLPDYHLRFISLINKRNKT